MTQNIGVPYLLVIDMPCLLAHDQATKDVVNKWLAQYLPCLIANLPTQQPGRPYAVDQWLAQHLPSLVANLPPAPAGPYASRHQTPALPAFIKQWVVEHCPGLVANLPPAPAGPCICHMLWLLLSSLYKSCQ